MNRKMLSVFLICMLVFSIVSPAFAAEDSLVTIVADQVSGKAGENVQVGLNIGNNTGFYLLTIAVKYDSNALEYLEISDVNSAVSIDENVSSDGERVNYFIETRDNKNYTGTGELAVLNFKIKDDCATGEYQITLDAYDDELDENFDDIVLVLENGSVTVTGADPAPTPTTYTVTMENGTANPQTAAENDSVTITADPAPEGQEFDNWTCDVDVLFDNANAETTTFTMPANDVTVTAHYKDKDEEKPAVEKVTVSFDANGGSGNMAAKTVEKGSTYTLPACDFTAPAEKKFKAWEVNGTEYKAADKITVTADTTVKAIWAAVQNPAAPKYDVVVTNGTGDGSYEASQTVTITADSKSGYTFKEWTVVSGDVTLKNKDAKTTTFVMPAEAVEVKATYTKNSYSGGGGGGSTTSSGGAAVVTKPDTTIILTIDKLVSTVNGQEIISDVAPIIVDGRTYTPARFVAEQLGAKVDWNEETQLVTVTGKDGVVIELRIGSNVALVNGKPVQMDAAAFIQDSRTYTPARFVAEQLGAKVDWDDTTRQVTITK